MSIRLPIAGFKPKETLFYRQLQDFKRKVHDAATTCGRNPLAIRIVGTTKDLMVDPVIEAAEAGLREFNEIFVPEGVTKRPPVDRTITGITWHFSGTLNTKNIPIAVEFFDVLHGIDRPTQLRSLLEAVEKKKKKGLQILIELNPLGVKKKSGLPLNELPKLLRDIQNQSSLKLIGLSFRPELGLTKTDRIKAYEEIQKCQQKLLQTKELSVQAIHLAMGSSTDFEDAIKFGSTILRIGSALFSGKPVR